MVDAVVLCTPNQFHLPYTERAVERGKAVLLEKPLGLQTAPPGQAERLLARRGARVMVAYVYRYTAVVGRLRALLRSGWGGSIWPRPARAAPRPGRSRGPSGVADAPLASGSGALGDFGSHLLDLLQYAAGVELAEAAGYGGTFLPNRRPDGQGNTCVENDDAFVFCGRGTGGAVQRLRQPGGTGRHPPVHLRRGAGFSAPVWRKASSLTGPKPRTVPTPRRGRRVRSTSAEPPGLRFCAAGRGVFGSGGGPPGGVLYPGAGRPPGAPAHPPGPVRPIDKSPCRRSTAAGGFPYLCISSPSSGSNWTPSRTGVPSARVWAAHRWTNSAARWAAVSSGSPGASPPAPRWRKGRRCRGTGRAPAWP